MQCHDNALRRQIASFRTKPALGHQAGDPEGHVWSFGQPKRIVTREDAERESGLKVTGWPVVSAKA